MNALMGKYFGLSWTGVTDHGGPNHSKVKMSASRLSILTDKDCINFTPIYSIQSGDVFRGNLL
jgi:hypothetical protein